MKHILSKKVFEQVNTKDGVPACDYYKDKKPEEGLKNFWEKYDKLTEEQKKEKNKEIQEYIGKIVLRQRKNYITWYNKKETIDKINILESNKKKGKVVTPELISEFTKYINTITAKLWYKPQENQPSMIARAWGYALYREPTIVNVNLYNFFNGTMAGDVNINDTVRHEFSHLIDWWFLRRGFDIYNRRHGILRGQEYEDNYLTGDSDMFTRLNVFRGVFNIQPLDTDQQVGQKIREKIKSGDMTSDIYDFDIIRDTVTKKIILQMTPKKGEFTTKSIKDEGTKLSVRTDKETAKLIYKLWMGSRSKVIIIGKAGRMHSDLKQLFANYAYCDSNLMKKYSSNPMSFIQNVTIYIDLTELTVFNKETAKVDTEQSSVASTTA